MAQFTVQTFGWQYDGNEEIFMPFEVTLFDNDGVIQYAVEPKDDDDEFDSVDVIGLDGLAVNGVPVPFWQIDGSYFGTVEWGDDNVSYVLAIRTAVDGPEVNIIIGGDPITVNSQEEFEQLELTITSVTGAPRSGDFAPGTPISLADIPGVNAPVLNLIEGGGKDDFLFGSQDADEIIGNGGADTLLGRDGDDVLNGGAGRDIVIGGEGTDTFVFGTGSELDIILDFDVTEDILEIDMDGSAARDAVAFVYSLANYTIVGIGGGDVAVLLGDYDRSDVVDSIEYL